MEPKEPKAIAKSPEKAAAVPRSAIRRRPMPRLRSNVNALRQTERERRERLEAEAAILASDTGPTTESLMERFRAYQRQPSERRGTSRLWGDADRPFLDSRRSPEFRFAPRSQGASEGVPVFQERWRSERYQRDRRPRAAPTPPYNDSESVPSEHSISPILPVPPTMTPSESPAPRSGSSSPRRAAYRVSEQARQADIRQVSTCSIHMAYIKF